VAVVNPDQEEPTVVFETEGDFFLGYRWVSTEDSLKAAEYIYPHSSFSFGLNLLSCPLPFRYNVNAAFISKHDFYSDVGFAYKDLVLFRDILVGVHHNLDHYNFKFDDEPLPKIHNDENPADYYYIDFVSNLMSLRLKAPDFPFHTFLNHRHVERDGRIEQRFLLGYFDQFEKVSESRDIEWKSNAVKLGANSHLGPVEIEYAYDEIRAPTTFFTTFILNSSVHLTGLKISIRTMSFRKPNHRPILSRCIHPIPGVLLPQPLSVIYFRKTTTA
jgi:hypothetical protein